MSYITFTRVTFILFGIACYLLGYAISKRGMKRNLAGKLVINTSDPDKDVYSLDVSIPLGEIPHKKFVTFKVEIT